MSTPQDKAVHFLVLGFLVWTFIVFFIIDITLLINGKDILLGNTFNSSSKLTMTLIALFLYLILYLIFSKVYVKSNYYDELDRKCLTKSKKEIFWGKFIALSYVFMPCVLIVVMCVIRKIYGPVI